MSERAAHGQARKCGAIVVQETPPTDELKPRSQAAAADPLVSGRRPNGTVATRAAAVAMAKLPRARRMVPRRVACDPAFKAKEESRREWLVKRRSELHAAHGGVSHGVGARLNAAAWAYAAGDFLSERAALTLDVDDFKAAASLNAHAKTLDDAAWEMASKEAEDRPRAAFNPRAGLVELTDEEPRP